MNYKIKKFIARIFRITTWEECERFYSSELSLTMLGLAKDYHERFFGGTPKMIEMSERDYLDYESIIGINQTQTSDISFTQLAFNGILIKMVNKKKNHEN